MKIIFICSKSITFNTFLKSQADYLLKKGIKVEVACSDNQNINFGKNLTHKINFPKKMLDFLNFPEYFKMYSQINFLVKKNVSALFYIHTPIASHFFRFFTLLKKIKIIYFIHGFRFTSKTTLIKSFFFKLIEKILSKNTNIFITINNEDYEYTRQNFIKNGACYKLNGVGLDLNNKNNKKLNTRNVDIKKILVIAAYKKDKGYFEILKVAELLKGKKIHIDCYGYGNYDKFRSIKVQKKLNNISFKRFDVNLEKKIKNYDIFLHLSKREGLPVSLMQCLLNGLPVICYNIRGNNDLIKDKFNGFFINSYEEIPSLISFLRLKKILFLKVKRNAFNSINQNFSKKNINLKLYKIISNFMKQNL